jgi:hypothetical protein
MQFLEQVVTCQLHTTSHKKKTTIMCANILKKNLHGIGLPSLTSLMSAKTKSLKVTITNKLLLKA